MWNAGALGETADGARIDAETPFFGSFLTSLEERLHAEADPQKRHARLNALDESSPYRQFVERAHHLAEMPDARQHDLRSSTQAIGIADQRVVAANFGESVLDRTQVSGSVVENSDHNSPLVDGSWSFKRASFEHANF